MSTRVQEGAHQAESQGTQEPGKRTGYPRVGQLVELKRRRRSLPFHRRIARRCPSRQPDSNGSFEVDGLNRTR
jgi:hypothetical protein